MTDYNNAPKSNLFTLVDDLFFKLTERSLYEFSPWRVWMVVVFLVAVMGMGVYNFFA